MNNIELEKNEKILKIWIRREIPVNPLNMDTIEEIYEAIRVNPSKIVIITGRNKAFSAGADIKGFLEMKPSDAIS
ncbi:Enoyl-CoA hydratase/isomerase, partial [mine drainage metagenome]